MGKQRSKNFNRILSFLTVIVLFITTFSEFATVVHAGVTTGSTGSVNATGSNIGAAGGVSHIDLPVFRVGIMRDPGFYNGGKAQDKKDILSSWSHRFPDNDESLFFTPNGYGSLYTNYEVGTYDPSSRKILKYGDNVSKARVINLASKPASATNVGKTKLAAYSFTGAKKYSSLSNGGWKVIASTITGSEANAIWSYILAPAGGGNYDVVNRMDTVISPHAKNYGSATLTPAQLEDIGRGYLGLLMATWRITPSQLRGPWEAAIEDYINNRLQAKGEKPVAIVIDTAMTLSFHATGKRMVLPSIDYFQYYTAVGSNWNIHKTTDDKIQGARGDTYTMLQKIVQSDITEAPKINRTADSYDANNVFSFAGNVINYPRMRMSTKNKTARWISNPNYLGIMELLKLGSPSPGKNLYGFVTASFALPDLCPTCIDPSNPDVGIYLVASPKDKTVPSSSEMIGEQSHLVFRGKPSKDTLNSWNKIFKDDPNVNKTIKIKITPNRQADPNIKTAPSYTSAQGNFTTGVDMKQADFMAFLSGKTFIKILDNTANEPIKANETKKFTYKPKMEITYVLNGKNETITLNFNDYTSFKRPPNPPEYIGYTSNVNAYAEFKNERPDNEEYEAMAGVPSNKRLYLGVGGNEFIVDVELEYKENVDSVWRTYRSYFDGTPSEFKAGDTAKTYTVPSPSGASSSSLTVDAHAGGTVTATWTGTTPYTGNLAWFDHGQSGADKWDDGPYNAAKAQAQAWATAVNGYVISHTSASDKVKRDFNAWGASITSDSNSHPAGSVSIGQAYVAPTPCSGNPCTGGDPGKPYIPTTGKQGTNGTYTITVTGSVPAHEICGPECTYDLPMVEDTWKQKINFDYMRISRAEVYKIEEGRITRVDNVFGEGNSELKATIKQGNPSIFYNIAQQNAGGDDKAAQSSKHGRIRYSLEENQHDVVVWHEGTRTNKSAGMGNNGNSKSPNAGGHNNTWATGILYTNKGYTTEKDFHRNRGGVNTAPSDKADTKDVATTEWKKFDERRKLLNKATVISDMLILQTSSGDQSVLYFDKDSETKQSQEQFPDLEATKQEMWDDNPNSAYRWEKNHIYVGSYNGKYASAGATASTNRKYWGYNQETNSFIDNSSGGSRQQVATRFDNNGAGVDMARTRPARPSKLYIYQTQDIVPTTQNGAYETGDAEVFYERLVSWRTPTPYEKYPGISLRDEEYKAEVQPNFSTKRGVVIESPYSDDHPKVNDIVIHTPVSTENAMIVSLPKYLDQRTEMPPGGAGSLIDEQNRLQNEKENSKTVEDFEPAVDKIITTTTVIKKKKETKTTTGGSDGATGSKDFTFTGGVQTFTAPEKGAYTLEVWGAQGGSSNTTYVGGLGGYSKGTVTLNKGEVVSIYVGGQASGQSGGWNGGGTGGSSGISYNYGGGGGGATDIRKGGTSLTNRILVAGGGGGLGGYGQGGSTSISSTPNASGGVAGTGGGATGTNGAKGASTAAVSGDGGTPGTQTAGGTGGETSSTSYGNTDGQYYPGGGGAGGGGYYGGGGGGGASRGGTSSYSGYSGSGGTLGQGGNGGNSGSSGSGYYSGSGGGGAGGSGYIGGVTGGTMQNGINSGNGKAKISYDIPPDKKETVESVDLPTSTNTTTSNLKSGDPTGYKGWTWEQLLGPTWRDYIIVKTTTTTETTTATSETSYEEESDEPEPEPEPSIGVSTDTRTPKATLGQLKLFGELGRVPNLPVNPTWGGGYSGGDVLVGQDNVYVMHMNANYVSQYTKNSDGTLGGRVRTNSWYDHDSTFNTIQRNNSSVPSAYAMFIENGVDKLVGWSMDSSTLYVWDIINNVPRNRQAYSAPRAMSTYSRAGWDGENYVYFFNSSNSSGDNGLYRWDITNKSAQPQKIVTLANGNSYITPSWTGSGLLVDPIAGEVYAGSGSNQSNGFLSAWRLSDGDYIGTWKSSQFSNAGISTLSGENGNLTLSALHRNVGYYFYAYSNTLVQVDLGQYGRANQGGGYTQGTPTTFNYTGNVQTFTAPHTGEYQLEVWGAQGGYGTGPGGTYTTNQWDEGGKGGYSKATFNLTAGQVVNIYVGGAGSNGRPSYSNGSEAGGWNGGGNGYLGGGGGGATDIRLGGTSYSNRVIVAGGGGGASIDATQSYGGSGGGANQSGTTGRQGNATPGTLTSGNGLGVGQNGTGGNSGGGGGGYYGGTTHSSGDVGGGGGSGYVNTSLGSNIVGQTGVQSGNGKAVITPLTIAKPVTTITIKSENIVTVTEVATITSVDEVKLKADLSKFPDRMPDGTWNPVKLKYGMFAPTPESPTNKPITTTNGSIMYLATFINIDYPFQVYFPNRGDFAQQPNLLGIDGVTTTRGKGYVNNMNTSEWTHAKKVRFKFNVIHKDVLYTAGSWIDLAVNEEYFDFYAVLANHEQVGSLVEFESIPINGRPIGDPVNENYEDETNKERFSDYSAYHGAYRKSYIDVVGRIGNFAVSDTDDFRFSNLFKQPVPEDKWVLEGIVKEVNIAKQNKYYGDLFDIRGEDIRTNGHMLNTYGTQTWLEKAPLTLPINPKDNEHNALKEQYIKPGYDIFADITSTGNYQEGVVRALPYYFKLDIDTGKVTPIDVYQKTGEEYKPVNLYRGADDGNLPSNLYPYSLILDWENESERRNFTMDESVITNRVAEIYGEYIYGIVQEDGGDPEEGITGYKRLTTPSGNFVSLGTSQRIVADKGARTFIGTTQTYGEDKNPGSVLPEQDYNIMAQRWHLKFGLPSSAVFVEAGKAVTKENIEAIQQGTGVLLLTADIISVGEIYTLKWEQPGVNTITLQKDGKNRTFNIKSSNLPPVIALYDLGTTAVIDVDVQGSH